MRSMGRRDFEIASSAMQTMDPLNNDQWLVAPVIDSSAPVDGGGVNYLWLHRRSESLMPFTGAGAAGEAFSDTHLL